MDAKKKLIYGIIIGVCVLGSAAVLLWGTGGGSTPELTINNTPAVTPTRTQTNTQVVRPSSDGTYPPPSVFPANNKLDTSLLNSSDFQVLKPYDALKLEQSEIGRNDPFAKY